MSHEIDKIMAGLLAGWMDGWMDRVFVYYQTCLLLLLSPSTALQPTSSQASEFYAVSILSLLRWCPLCSAPQGVSLWLLSLFQHVGLANRAMQPNITYCK